MTSLIAATFPLANDDTRKIAVMVDQVVAVESAGYNGEYARIHLTGGHSTAVAASVDDVLGTMKAARQARYEDGLNRLLAEVQDHTPGGAR